MHELGGFIANDLLGAFDEAYALSKVTKCKQYLFSLSLNPPANEDVGTPAFTRVADEAEKRLGLEGQPRAIVFHEKEGRRHAHVVWSRIKLEDDKFKAVNLPFYKSRLSELSKEQYLQHGWDLPDGFKDRSLRDPSNFTLKEWQQALRSERDPREIKQVFRSAWLHSDNAQSLNAALMQNGFILARGDRRGYVAMDYKGEVYSFARYAGVKTREVKERLGPPDQFPSIDEAKAKFRESISPNLDQKAKALKAAHRKQKAIEREKKLVLARQHKKQREALARSQRQERRARIKKQSRETAESFKALLGNVWDRVTGKTAQQQTQAQYAAWAELKAQQMQKDDLLFDQMEHRRKLQRETHRLKLKQLEERKRLDRLVGRALEVGDKPVEPEQYKSAEWQSPNRRCREGPELER